MKPTIMQELEKSKWHHYNGIDEVYTVKIVNKAIQNTMKELKKKKY